MKTCLVIGYMNRNLGDDLFFQILFNRYPDVKFYFYPPSVYLKKYKKIFKKNKNVVFYDKEEYYLGVREDIIDEKTSINLFPMICERAKQVDCMVNIGGSIFIQNPNWKNDDRFILKDLLEKKPSFIIGCNFGPGDKEFYDFYKEWFKKFDDVCFRDKESYNMFKKLDNTRIADDIVLINNKKKSHNITRRRVGISVIDLENNKELKAYKDDYIQFIRNYIKYLKENKYKITLFSFCEADGDLRAISEILDSFADKKNIDIVNYDDDIHKFLNKWKKNDFIISTRFHASILALKYEQAFIPLVYSEKTNHYLKKIDGRIKTYNIKNIKNQKIDKMEFRTVIDNYNSEKQFEILDKFLKGE